VDVQHDPPGPRPQSSTSTGSTTGRPPCMLARFPPRPRRPPDPRIRNLVAELIGAVHEQSSPGGLGSGWAAVNEGPGPPRQRGQAASGTRLLGEITLQHVSSQGRRLTPSKNSSTFSTTERQRRATRPAWPRPSRGHITLLPCPPGPVPYSPRLHPITGGIHSTPVPVTGRNRFAGAGRRWGARPWPAIPSPRGPHVPPVECRGLTAPPAVRKAGYGETGGSAVPELG